MKHLNDLQLRSLSLSVFLLVWQLAALWANDTLFPTPLAVLDSFYHHLIQGELLHHLGITLMRVAAIFGIAMSIGIIIGILMGHYRKVDAVLDGLLVMGLNLPALVTIFLCYIWLGLTDTAAITAVVINKVPNVVVTVREGARAVDRDLMEVAQVFRVSPLRILRCVYLPQLYPYLMAAARSGLALIWKIVLVVELLGRSDGMGFQLSIFFQFFDITSILAYSIAFIGVVLVVEGLVMRPLDRRLLRWRK